MKLSLTIITLIISLISILYLVKKRKKLGITGFKTALTSICFYLIAMNSIIFIWLEQFGLLFWTINVVLLLLAFRFTKYFPKYVEN